MKKEFRHQLLESFQYSANGEFQKADLIVVEAPKSSGFYDNLQFLDSLCNKAEMRAMKNIAPLLKELDDIKQEDKEKAKEINENKSEDEIALDSYNQLMSGLNQDEIPKLNIAILELLKKSAKVDGEKNFEETFWDEIGIEDRRLLIGKYVANFTVSAQRNLKKK